MLLALMFATTFARIVSLLTAPIAMLIAVIEWAGPGAPLPLAPTLLALALAATYVVSTLLFNELARRTARRH